MERGELNKQQGAEKHTLKSITSYFDKAVEYYFCEEGEQPADEGTIEPVEYFEQRMKELLDGMIETLDNALEDTCPE